MRQRAILYVDAGVCVEIYVAGHGMLSFGIVPELLVHIAGPPQLATASRYTQDPRYFHRKIC